ncbi:hypothetical protein N8Z33_03140 [Flavobacteriaceae bacterium]|nr:hypothetical protein [Flavobacteriaceae bacterium]
MPFFNITCILHTALCQLLPANCYLHTYVIENNFNAAIAQKRIGNIAPSAIYAIAAVGFFYGNGEVTNSKDIVYPQNRERLSVGYATSMPSLEIAEKMATALNMSLDELVHGQQNEKARIRIAYNELLNLFNKTQELSDDQKKTVMELLSAFLLKSNLKQQLG